VSNSGLGLFSVANQISSLGGEYGFRPRSVNSDSPTESGAIFWFSIPLIVPLLKTVTTNEDEKKFKSGREGSHLCRKRLTDFGNSRFDEGARMDNVFTSEKTRRIESAPFSIKTNGCIEEEDTVLQSKRPKKSLIIDDSLVIRKSLGKAMSRMGYIIDYATNGLEGLKCLQETIYDVTFCDFLMPVMDGLDCVQQYREWEIAHRPWFKQYIIGISAHASPNDAQRGLQAGMNDFKPKPITLVQLQEIEKGEHLIELNQELNTMYRKEHFIGERSSVCETSHNYATSANSISAPLQSGPICLLGESEPSDHMRNAVSRLGWRAVQVQDGEDALRLLKVRNWDAVLIENELPRLSGIRCVARFREWENENRIARQCNVLLLSNDIISNPGQTVTASHPKGFDGVLVRPISIRTLASYLERACGINSEAADSKNIVTR
jgi:CheY-like chemotaxis protein